MNSQKDERKSIYSILKDRSKTKEEKKEAKNKLKELERFVHEESRSKTKEKFNYLIFLCQPEHVGITATGEEDINELPEIFEQFKKFQQDPDLFKETLGVLNESNS